MDPMYQPPCECKDLVYRPGPPGTFSGRNWIGPTYIENRGQAIYDTLREGYPDYVTNNSPAVILYIRVMPSLSSPGKMVFYINGWETPRLHLIRGKKYQLNVAGCGYPFLLTSDSKGGTDKGNLMGIKPYDYGVTTVFIGPDMPANFFYQCSTFAGMGGQVVVDEKK